MAEAGWLVGRGGQQLGPFGTGDLMAKLARGEVAPTDLVWREGMADWAAASAVPELQPPPPEPVPVVYAPEPQGGAMWLISRGGQQLGPYSTADVQAMAASGQVARGDLLWHEGMADWRPIAELPEFAGALRPVPPTPPPGPAAPPFAPAGPFGPGFIEEFFGGLRAIVMDPDQGLSDAADKKNVVTYLVWIGIAALAYALTTLPPLVKLGAPFGLVVEAFFKTILVALVSAGALFGAVWLAAGPILKTKAGVTEALAIVGLSNIPVAIVGAAVFVLTWLTWYSLILWVGAGVMQIVFFYHLFLSATKAPRKAALYAVPAIYLCTAIVLGILARLTM